MKQFAILMFRRISKIFVGTGLGKFPLIMRIYDFLYSLLKPKEISLIEVQGNKIYIDTSGHVVSRALLMTGIWEKDVTDLFKRIVKEGMTVVDIGANIGYYTLLAADLVGKKGRVFAFEPDPHIYSLLVKNVEANGYKNVIPVNKAVSNKVGTAELFLNPSNKDDHRLCKSYNGQEHVNVEVVTLDNFFKAYNPRVDVIKMDIEGGRWRLFRE